MGVRFPWAWLPAEWSAKLIPLTGPKREGYGEGIERGVIGLSGGAALLAKLAWGWYFFLPRVSLLMVGDRWVR